MKRQEVFVLLYRIGGYAAAPDADTETRGVFSTYAKAFREITKDQHTKRILYGRDYARKNWWIEAWELDTGLPIAMFPNPRRTR